MTLPELKPWNGFDLNQSSSYTDACRAIAGLLADDQWHPRQQVVEAVAAECLDLQRKTIDGLIGRLIAHGDVRVHLNSPRRDRLIRLTTRWASSASHGD